VVTARQPNRFNRGGVKTKRWDGTKYAPKRKVCQFCSDKIEIIDYKDVTKLRRFISDRGKIEPRRRTGTCARHQRALAVAIKRAAAYSVIAVCRGARPQDWRRRHNRVTPFIVTRFYRRLILSGSVRSYCAKANISAEEDSEKAGTRVPEENEFPRRPSGLKSPAGEGALAAHRV